jgi:hypothetical protein
VGYQGEVSSETYVRRGGVALEVGLDRAVLLVEESHVGYEVLDHVHVREWVDARFLGCVCGNAACDLLVRHFFYSNTMIQHTETGQCVDTVNVHRTTSANSLSATPPECQGRVHLVLDPDQCVQHHRSSLVEVKLVRLHLGLGGWLIGVPSVDVEGLGLRILLRLRLASGGCLALRDGLGGGIGNDCFGGLGNGVAGVDIAHGGEAASEGGGPYGCDVSVSDTYSIASIVCIYGVVPVRLVARRVNARSEAMLCRVWSGECGMS